MMQGIKNNYIAVGVFTLGLFVSACIFYVSNSTFTSQGSAFFVTQEALADKAMRDAREAITESSYDRSASIRKYKRALAIGGDRQDVLSELTHVLIVDSQYEEALKYADRFKAAHPNEKRIEYLRGLALGKQGRYDEAVEAFEVFKQDPQSSWPTRLDLAWVQFQKGDINAAEATLKDAIQEFGNNMWLATSLGGVNIAQGKNESARAELRRAREFAKRVTIEDIRKNYAMNNPARADERLMELRSVIDANEKILNGGVVSEALSKLAFVGLSPEGSGAGFTVSACGDGPAPECAYHVVLCEATNSCGPERRIYVCDSSLPTPNLNYNQTYTQCMNAAGVNTQPNTPQRTVVCNQMRNAQIQQCAAGNPSLPANYGQTCSAANVCGVTGTGTINCSGQCQANAGLPAGFGTACTVNTACGPSAGRINCNGQCNVSRLNTCPGVIIIGDESDEEVDEFGNRIPRFGCAAAKVKIKALPLLVRKGKVSAIQWVANEAVSCTVTGGGQTWTGLQGVQITSPIQETTKYTITCQPMAQCTGNGALPFSAHVEVKVVPDWQEI